MLPNCDCSMSLAMPSSWGHVAIREPQLSLKKQKGIWSPGSKEKLENEDPNYSKIRRKRKETQNITFSGFF